MNLRQVIAGTAVAMSAFVAVNFGSVSEARAAEKWEARTVEQVKADLKDNQAGEKEYTIKSGDTLGVIANAAQVDVNALAQLNEIANANLIFPGTVLTFDMDAQGKVAKVEVENQGQKQSVNVKQTTTQAQTVQQPAQTQTQSRNVSYSGQSSSAKEIIAQRESGGSYSARNGRYIGRYQLDASYLNGDYSQANQERVADNYVSQRYGSWDAALAFWNNNGWY
ncbi:MAG: LysM peptidoglycan-binding domain-containing protein [Aerococcus sp.]|nr:LysM peptidoglycan-binding domain-containing protein [Aerococcus sp.]